MKTVLFVDDEPAVRLFAGRFLRSAGFRVLAADTAKKAFEMAVEEKPDIILMDIYLGGRLIDDATNGVALCRQIKSDYRTTAVPVIILTAHGDREHVTASVKAGADDFIVKPIQPDVMAEKINKVLGSPGARASRVPMSGQDARAPGDPGHFAPSGDPSPQEVPATPDSADEVPIRRKRRGSGLAAACGEVDGEDEHEESKG